MVEFGRGERTPSGGLRVRQKLHRLKARLARLRGPDVLDTQLDPRKGSVLREAMVLGFAEGVLWEWLDTNAETYPRDTDVVNKVLCGARRHADLYPALAFIAQRDADRKRT